MLACWSPALAGTSIERIWMIYIFFIVRHVRAGERSWAVVKLDMTLSVINPMYKTSEIYLEQTLLDTSSAILMS